MYVYVAMHALVYRSSISIELAGTMFLQLRSERRRYREMILRQRESEEQRQQRLLRRRETERRHRQQQTGEQRAE